LYNPWGVDLPFAGRRLVEFGNRTYSQELATFRVSPAWTAPCQRKPPMQGWYWNGVDELRPDLRHLTTQGAIRKLENRGPRSGRACCASPETPHRRLREDAGDLSTVIPVAYRSICSADQQRQHQMPTRSRTGLHRYVRAYDALFAVNADAHRETVSSWLQ